MMSPCMVDLRTEGQCMVSPCMLAPCIVGPCMLDPSSMVDPFMVDTSTVDASMADPRTRIVGPCMEGPLFMVDRSMVECRRPTSRTACAWLPIETASAHYTRAHRPTWLSPRWGSLLAIRLNEITPYPPIMID